MQVELFSALDQCKNATVDNNVNLCYWPSTLLLCNEEGNMGLDSVMWTKVAL